ncbi:hypothetical protein CPAR01_12268 [Colletotrichum paranaense]|uniref:Integral membrane protein n=1 Tax=Colletotrichum paranaense TaxID=1914294 RepID=A0ABQ9S9H8_9PEZI|nr:uncharacterized protein CPAR01_12268 [Colletotrichum paranaense]KAK1529956.1 hypothetical protein CPAR01_12268 [Colletotrichum paranaense]
MSTFITPANFAATIGLAATMMGSIVTLKPELGIRMWHFDIASSEDFKDPESENRSLILDELRLFAIREFFIGASLFAAAYFGNHKTLAAMCLLGVPVVTIDGIVQRRQAPKADWWVHFALAPVFAGLGVASWRQ